MLELKYYGHEGIISKNFKKIVLKFILMTTIIKVTTGKL